MAQALTKKLVLRAGLAALALLLCACGLGRSPDRGEGPIKDPVVAARVNGRPIYKEDVRAYAVSRGFLKEGEELDVNSDAFYFALDELIEARLFSMEAEARGLDRDPDVRRRLEAARERVLANAIYEDLQQKASDPAVVERLYRENTGRLGQGQDVHLRHIQLDTREAANAAKRRLDAGEKFEALAFELSTDRDTAADGGDLRFTPIDELQPPLRELVERTNVGGVIGPVQVGQTWQLFLVEDRRERGVPSLETLRPQIVQWNLFTETQKLRDRLERDARIERASDNAPRPAESGAPGDAQQPGAPPAPTYRPRDRQAPPNPFPMGPGGVYGAPRPEPEAPAAQAAQPEAPPAEVVDDGEQ